MFADWIATDLLLRFVRYKFNGILRVVPNDIREYTRVCNTKIKVMPRL